jgi:OOP family OmpA-OmpF porin
MKKLLLLSLFITNAAISLAQTSENSEKIETESVDNSTFNKWFVELNTGYSKGLNPYTSGYHTSIEDKKLGGLKFNSFNVGIRYMLTPKFGIKTGVSYDKFNNFKSSSSKDFETEQFRFDLQGVINGAQLFDLQDKLGRFNFLIHGGLNYSRLTPTLDTPIDIIGGTSNYNITENNIGVVFGITPEFRITNRLAFIMDFSMYTNYRQNLAWDGHKSLDNNNSIGKMINGTVGLNYSFGKQNTHGDYARVEDKKVTEKYDGLQQRIAELETMMNDTDKDGVPDYLDSENNSLAGVAVDTKGRMVDLNNNSVPDELEKYLTTNYNDKADQERKAEVTNSKLVKNLINEGFVTTYFDINKSKPTNVSTEGIDFILTYLRNNPSASVEIYGSADEAGKSEYNDKLALARANNVKNTLVKAGIDASRLSVISKGEDTSVDPSSKEAKNLVRRVTFKVK